MRPNLPIVCCIGILVGKSLFVRSLLYSSFFSCSGVRSNITLGFSVVNGFLTGIAGGSGGRETVFCCCGYGLSQGDDLSSIFLRNVFTDISQVEGIQPFIPRNRKFVGYELI
jgi:hypothetical protein